MWYVYKKNAIKYFENNIIQLGKKKFKKIK